MAAKSTTFDNQFLLLILNATPIANIADNAASAPLTNLYLALHTASPGVGGNQQTNEAAYTSYVRAAVSRSNTGFTVSTNTATLAANITFASATGGSETETFASIGTASSGAGEILWFGPITPTIVVTSGVAPVLTSGSVIIES